MIYLRVTLAHIVEWIGTSYTNRNYKFFTYECRLEGVQVQLYSLSRYKNVVKISIKNNVILYIGRF